MKNISKVLLVTFLASFVSESAAVVLFGQSRTKRIIRKILNTENDATGVEVVKAEVAKASGLGKKFQAQVDKIAMERLLKIGQIEIQQGTEGDLHEAIAAAFEVAKNSPDPTLVSKAVKSTLDWTIKHDSREYLELTKVV